MPSPEESHSLTAFQTEFDSLDEFNERAMRLFHWQRTQCKPYREFLEYLGRPAPKNVEDIPHLPISAFKQHRVISSEREAELVFRSSGTTDSVQSCHHVVDASIYKEAHTEGFRNVYGSFEDYAILALLPGYLERSDASLVHMVESWIDLSGHPASGFYLDDFEGLANQLAALKEKGQKTLLIGVTFALLDFSAQFSIDFPELIVMETGGMKGRRKEMIRAEVHDLLRTGFNVENIHSEYGMTELLSQAYAVRQGKFTAPPWMKVTIHDIRDRLSLAAPYRSGLIHLIDLANIHSCAFIATDDIGRYHEDSTFEVLGRFDRSEVRGCNLMVQ
jgi:hypothetical protein